MTTESKPEGGTQEGESRAVMRWEESGVPAKTVGMARAMVASGYFKNVTSVAQAVVKMEMGKALGVSPVEAMQYLHIFTTGADRTSIQLGYPLVGALIQRSGKYHFDVRTRTDTECEIDFHRILAGGETKKLGTSHFTIEKARAAGLVNKEVWKAYPDVMLYARALTHGAKAFCPEILGGAGIAADAPYVEGEAQIVDADAPPPTIEEPPEGFTNHWTRFWAFTKEAPPGGLGLTEEQVQQVHQFFGTESLKEAATKIVNNTGKTEAEVVAEFELTIREAHPTPVTDEEREAEERSGEYADVGQGHLPDGGE
jgi:hypothetical protein